MPRHVLAVLAALLAWWPADPAAAVWTGPARGSGRVVASAPSPPTSFEASCNLLLSTSITLTWAPSPVPVTGYEIGRGSTAGSYTWGPVVTGTSWSTPALGIGTYHFAVRAVRGPWASAPTPDRARTVVLFLACV